MDNQMNFSNEFFADPEFLFGENFDDFINFFSAEKKIFINKIRKLYLRNNRKKYAEWLEVRLEFPFDIQDKVYLTDYPYISEYGALDFINIQNTYTINQIRAPYCLDNHMRVQLENMYTRAGNDIFHYLICSNQLILAKDIDEGYNLLLKEINK